MTDQPPHDPDRTRNADAPGAVVSPQRARQGRSGVRILLVMVVSLALIVLLYMLLWGGTQEQMGELETSADERAAAATFEGDASGPPPPVDGVQPATPE
ncbi:MAG: hypothetical protein ACK4FB_01240 [Brevundimonas sp.]|uniref:hypothetical protein n=1 Tax=Brevundimonas sp. TaxID=1871086 RepID=UPI00391D084F